MLRETERIDKLRRRIVPSADVIVAAGWPEAVIGRAVRERHASLLITGACWRTVLAAEPDVSRIAPRSPSRGCHRASHRSSD